MSGALTDRFSAGLGVTGADLGDANVYSAANFAALDTSSMTDGDLGLALDTGVYWRWDATNSFLFRVSPLGFGVETSVVNQNVEADPAADGWTEGVAAGGAIDYDTEVAGKVAIKGGTAQDAFSTITAPGNRTASAQPLVGMIITAATAAGSTAGNAAAFFDLNYSDGADKRVSLVWKPGTGTNWFLRGSGDTDTGIAVATAKDIELYLTPAAGFAIIFIDRAASMSYVVGGFTGAAGSAPHGFVQSGTNPASAQTVIEYDAYHLIEFATAT